MPKPKRRSFEIRQKRKQRLKRTAANLKESRVFQQRLRALFSRINRRLDRQPIHVLFVCAQGIAQSSLMQAGLLELAEKTGIKNFFVALRGRSTFSDVFNPERKKIDYIVFDPANINLGWVKGNWERVEPKSGAELIEFHSLQNTGIFDEINYKRLVLKLLEKEAAKEEIK